MRFSVLSSGSSGNATYVETEGRGSERRGILIDCGITARRLKPLLAGIGRSVEDIGAILLTHGHSDHTCGLRTFGKLRPVPVVSGPGVGEKFGARIVEAGITFEVCGLSASFFTVPHDAPTCGVRLTFGESSMALATDFGEVPAGVLPVLRGVDALVVEANHDLDWLRSGPYPEQLKRRVASGQGHLSNDQAADLALALTPHGLTEVVLAHLSERNNSPARAVGTVSRMLREAGFPGVRVRAALQRRSTGWVEVGKAPEQPMDFTYEPSSSGGLFGVSEGR